MDNFKLRIPTMFELQKWLNMEDRIFYHIITDFCNVTSNQKGLNLPYFALSELESNPIKIYQINMPYHESQFNTKSLNNFTTDTSIGVRPILQVPDWYLASLDKQANDNEIFRFSFGEYPKQLETMQISNILEKKYKSKKLDKTSRFFTDPFSNNSYNEYIYQNNRYIRIILNHDVRRAEKKYRKNTAVWLKIEPITWLYDKKTKTIISENILFNLNNGILMHFSDSLENFKNGLDFILNNVVLQEMMQGHYLQTSTKQPESPTIIEKNNNFLLENKDTDIYKTNNNNNFYSPHINSKQYYGIYLTDIGYQSNPAIGREQEIRELSKNLLINKTGTVLIGEPGVGKTAIIEGLAYKIQKGEVCDALKNKGILSVNVGELISSTKYRGEFEEKITRLCHDLMNNKDVILFIDEMHMSVNAGCSDGNSIDMANILKEYITNDQIKIIGCTTTTEFQEYFSQDKAFRRRFNIIEVKEPNIVCLKSILQNIMTNLANKHNVKLNLDYYEIDQLIDLIIELSHRKPKYVYESFNNPDASIKILTNCFAYMIIENLKEINYKNFLEAIKDNANLGLSQLEIENKLTVNTEQNLLQENVDRDKIFAITKKGV